MGKGTAHRMLPCAGWSEFGPAKGCLSTPRHVRSEARFEHRGVALHGFLANAKDAFRLAGNLGYRIAAIDPKKGMRSADVGKAIFTASASELHWLRFSGSGS